MENLTNKIAEVINYELDMLHFTATQMQVEKGRNRFLHDALLESFLIHARNLIEFFYPSRLTLKFNGLRAKLYVNNWKTLSKTQCLSAKKKDISQRLAHMAQERTLPNIDWNITAIYNEVRSLTQVFYNNLKAEQQQQLRLPPSKLQSSIICASGETVGRSLFLDPELYKSIRK